MNSDTPLNVLLQQAADLKTEQLALDRRRFDSWDIWYRNSLFAKDEIKLLRKTPFFEDRMEQSMKFKDEGNNYYKDGDFISAMISYDTALSMWEWIDTSVEDWRRTAINDKDLTQCKYNPSSKEESDRISNIRCTLLLNLASCYLHQKEWDHCILACTRVLEVEPENVKALYRRSLARTTPLSSGTLQLKAALSDLKTAARISPDNTTIVLAYNELKSSLQKQDIKDKQTFSNLFDRGRVYSEDDEMSTAAARALQKTSDKARPNSEDSKNELKDEEYLKGMTYFNLENLLDQLDTRIREVGGSFLANGDPVAVDDDDSFTSVDSDKGEDEELRKILDQRRRITSIIQKEALRLGLLTASEIERGDKGTRDIISILASGTAATSAAATPGSKEDIDEKIKTAVQESFRSEAKLLANKVLSSEPEDVRVFKRMIATRLGKTPQALGLNLSTSELKEKLLSMLEEDIFRCYETCNEDSISDKGSGSDQIETKERERFMSLLSDVISRYYGDSDSGTFKKFDFFDRRTVILISIFVALIAIRFFSFPRDALL